VWSDATYLTIEGLKWDGNRVEAVLTNLTLTNALGGFDTGDVVYYTNAYDKGYIGAVRNDDGLAKADGTNCFNNFGAVV